MKSPIIDEYKCGCTIAGDKLGIITWDKCAIHSKAPAMYEALTRIAKGEEPPDPYPQEMVGENLIHEINFYRDVAASALEGL